MSSGWAGFAGGRGVGLRASWVARRLVRGPGVFRGRYRAEDPIPVPPGFDAVRRVLGAKPLPPASGKPKGSPATRFAPAGKSVHVARFVNALTEDAGERKTYTEAFENAIKEIKKAAAVHGMENDVSAGVAVYVTVLYVLATGKEVSDADSEKLAGQIAAALNVPEIAALSDGDKQAAFEHGICTGVLFLLLASAVENDEKAAVSLKTVGGALLGDLFGAEPGSITLGATGLAVKRAPARPSGGGVAVAGEGPKTPVAGSGGLTVAPNRISYTLPAGSRVEKLGETTIIWRPKYDGYTRNERNVEQLYYMVLPARLSSSQPNRDAAFDILWKDISRALNIEWPARTAINRMNLPSGANCYIAIAGRKMNETFGGYGEHDLDRLTFCLLDFGKLYVPVAQIYRHTTGYDNQHYLQGAFDTFLNTVKVEGATAPPLFVTRDTLLGAWSHSSGWTSFTDYYYRSSGNFAGSEINSSSARTDLTFNANGTVRYEFFWLYNGSLRTDKWTGKWTLTNGKLNVTNGGDRNYNYHVVQHGKHPQSGERFLCLYRSFTTDRPASPQNSFFGSDAELYVPMKK